MTDRDTRASGCPHDRSGDSSIPTHEVAPQEFAQAIVVDDDDRQALRFVADGYHGRWLESDIIMEVSQ